MQIFSWTLCNTLIPTSIFLSYFGSSEELRTKQQTAARMHYILRDEARSSSAGLINNDIYNLLSNSFFLKRSMIAQYPPNGPLFTAMFHLMNMDPSIGNVEILLSMNYSWTIRELFILVIIGRRSYSCDSILWKKEIIHPFLGDPFAKLPLPF